MHGWLDTQVFRNLTIRVFVTTFFAAMTMIGAESLLLHIASGGATPEFWNVAIRQDSIAAWVEECVVFEKGAFTAVGKNKDEWKDKEYNPSVSTLFGSYRNYCTGAGEKQPETLNTFSPMLLDLCQKVLGHKYVERDRDNRGVRGFVGIRLRLHDGETPISDILTTTSESLTTPPDNPETSCGEHSDNPDNLLDKKNNEVQEIIDFSPPSIYIDKESGANDSSDEGESSGKGFKQTMPQAASHASEVKQNNVSTRVSSTDNQNSGESSVENKQSVGAKRKLAVGDKCEYCGSDPNLHQQYGGVLVIAELKYGKVALTLPNGTYTTWLNASDLRLL